MDSHLNALTKHTKITPQATATAIAEKMSCALAGMSRSFDNTDSRSGNGIARPE